MPVSEWCPIGLPPNFSLPSGTVRLYQDLDWNSRYLDLTLDDYRSNARQSIAGTFMQDQASLVAFNLPVGTVMTLTDNVVSTSGAVWDVQDCGICVDLVGTGSTLGVNLAEHANDCISAFFWRTVDLNQGAVELYEDINFGGNRNVIFLSEWSSAQVHSIADWWINDKVSSVRWSTLADRQTVTLFDNADGSGAQYANINGWGRTKENAFVGDQGFNDCMSSFRWDPLQPKKEIVAPFTLNLPINPNGATSLSETSKGTNDAATQMAVTVTLTKEKSQTITVTTTDTYSTGFSFSTEYSESTDLLGEKNGLKVTVGLTFDYTTSTQKSTSVTDTLGLSVSQTANAPPYTNFNCTLTVQIGDIPATVYQTTAQRWYDQPVTGGVIDPANNNWYKRTETVTGSIAGGLACSTEINMLATPLPGHPATAAAVAARPSRPMVRSL